MQEFDKQYYKIKEVAEILEVPQSTVRFWEKEFPTQVKPTRNAHNLRYYRPSDIEKLRIIKYLIKDKGLKIEAARTYLRSNPQNVSKRMLIMDDLTEVRNELAGLLRAIGGRKL
ncbi:MAG: MerR family transcriptional regulator [Muribaculaceae bacterium]|nr:MerR family transcriptional regulator [Bacteroidales bacterium]MDE6242495.1 MerR family transcriptional regulator [Muribaculaceae bacterium]